LVWRTVEPLSNGYRYEFHSDRALVFKGDSDEPSYTITFAGCDCPAAAYGKRPCKHEKALSFTSAETRAEEAEGVVVTGHAPGASGMSTEDADSFLDMLN
jgi:hypothetical protein